MSTTSPSVNNLSVLKGTVAFQLAGSGSFRPLGNVPSISFTPSIEKIEHYSSQAGVKQKDATIITQVGGAISLTMDEFTPENLAMALMGTVSGTGTTGKVFSMLSNTTLTGVLRITGTNTQGNKFAVADVAVQVLPDQEINFISDEIATMQLSLDWIVNPANTTSPYGTVTEI